MSSTGFARGTICRALTAATLAIAFGITLPGSSSAEDKVRVALGIEWPAYAMWNLAAELDQVPGLELEVSTINDPFAAWTLLGAEQTDIVHATMEYAPIAAEQEVPIKLVAFTTISYGADHVVGVEGMDDITNIRGSRVAAVEGYLGQIMVGIWLAEQGVNVDEVNWINLAGDQAASAMLAGDIDLAYLFSPYTEQVIEQLDGSTILGSTRKPNWLEKGFMTDAVYMSDKFLAEQPELAAKAMKAFWEAVAFWQTNPLEANQMLSDILQWKLADINAINGVTGTREDSTIWQYSFMEAARICAGAPGDGPFGQKNGHAYTAVETINDWWIKFGQMTQRIDPGNAVDCSVMNALYDSGYRGK